MTARRPDQLDHPIVAEAQQRVADLDPKPLVSGCKRPLDVGREPGQLDRPEREPRAERRDRDDRERREHGQQPKQGMRDPADHVIALALLRLRQCGRDPVKTECDRALRRPRADELPRIGDPAAAERGLARWSRLPDPLAGFAAAGRRLEPSACLLRCSATAPT